MRRNRPQVLHKAVRTFVGKVRRGASLEGALKSAGKMLVGELLESQAFWDALDPPRQSTDTRVRASKLSTKKSTRRARTSPHSPEEAHIDDELERIRKLKEEIDR